MPPVLDPSRSKKDGLAFLGLSLTRKSGQGHPDSLTHQTAFDLNDVLDRDYKFLASTNDDGWLAGGGEPGPPESYKLAAPDSSHVEILRIGTYRPEWGGLNVQDVVEAIQSGHILIPQIEVLPTAVVANTDLPPELEIRFDMEAASHSYGQSQSSARNTFSTDTSDTFQQQNSKSNFDHPPDAIAGSGEDIIGSDQTDDYHFVGDVEDIDNFELTEQLPVNWQLRFLHNQLFHYFDYPSRFCPGAFHSTIVRKAEFRSLQHRQNYFNMCEKAVQDWRRRGPQPLLPPDMNLLSQNNIQVIRGESTSSEYNSGIWLFTDRNNISHYFAPNFLPPYTGAKRKLILQALSQEWDEKALTWIPYSIPMACKEIGEETILVEDETFDTSEEMHLRGLSINDSRSMHTPLMASQEEQWEEPQENIDQLRSRFASDIDEILLSRTKEESTGSNFNELSEQAAPSTLMLAPTVMHTPLSSNEEVWNEADEEDYTEEKKHETIQESSNAFSIADKQDNTLEGSEKIDFCSPNIDIVQKDIERLVAHDDAEEICTSLIGFSSRESSPVPSLNTPKTDDLTSSVPNHNQDSSVPNYDHASSIPDLTINPYVECESENAQLTTSQSESKKTTSIECKTCNLVDKNIFNEDLQRNFIELEENVYSALETDDDNNLVVDNSSLLEKQSNPEVKIGSFLFGKEYFETQPELNDGLYSLNKSSSHLERGCHASPFIKEDIVDSELVITEDLLLLDDISSPIAASGILPSIDKEYLLLDPQRLENTLPHASDGSTLIEEFLSPDPHIAEAEIIPCCLKPGDDPSSLNKEMRLGFSNVEEQKSGLGTDDCPSLFSKEHSLTHHETEEQATTSPNKSLESPAAKASSDSPEVVLKKNSSDCFEIEAEASLGDCQEVFESSSKEKVAHIEADKSSLNSLESIQDVVALMPVEEISKDISILDEVQSEFFSARFTCSPDSDTMYSDSQDQTQDVKQEIGVPLLSPEEVKHCAAESAGPKKDGTEAAHSVKAVKFMQLIAHEETDDKFEDPAAHSLDSDTVEYKDALEEVSPSVSNFDSTVSKEFLPNALSKDDGAFSYAAHNLTLKEVTRQVEELPTIEQFHSSSLSDDDKPTKASPESRNNVLLLDYKNSSPQISSPKLEELTSPLSPESMKCVPAISEKEEMDTILEGKDEENSTVGDSDCIIKQQNTFDDLQVKQSVSATAALVHFDDDDILSASNNRNSDFDAILVKQSPSVYSRDEQSVRSTISSEEWERAHKHHFSQFGTFRSETPPVPGQADLRGLLEKITKPEVKKEEDDAADVMSDYVQQQQTSCGDCGVSNMFDVFLNRF